MGVSPFYAARAFIVYPDPEVHLGVYAHWRTLDLHHKVRVGYCELADRHIRLLFQLSGECNFNFEVIRMNDRLHILVVLFVLKIYLRYANI